MQRPTHTRPHPRFVLAAFRGALHRRVVRALRRQEKIELLHACALSVQRVFRGSLGRAIHKAERKRQYWERRVRQADQAVSPTV